MQRRRAYDSPYSCARSARKLRCTASPMTGPRHAVVSPARYHRGLTPQQPTHNSGQAVGAQQKKGTLRPPIVITDESGARHGALAKGKGYVVKVASEQKTEWLRTSGRIAGGATSVMSRSRARPTNQGTLTPGRARSGRFLSII